MVEHVAWSRFEIWLVNLDPTIGSEIRKSRPAVVVSPNEMNQHARTLIIAPMTTGSFRYVTRIPIEIGGKSGHIVLDQIRAIDKQRLIKRLGELDQATSQQIASTLTEMFAY